MDERLIEIKVALVRRRRSIKELWASYTRNHPDIKRRQFMYYLGGYAGRSIPDNFIAECEDLVKTI